MLIAVEGCLGVGKSTVSVGLAASRQSNLLLEAFESHPFLDAFYQDPAGNALETEFGFLLIHYHQLKSRLAEIRGAELIADFHLGKDVIYTELNVKNDRHKQIFMDLYHACREKVGDPQLMICLTAPTELIIERINKRNRAFELATDSQYYAEINEAYDAFFASYAGEKIVIPMDKWDFVENPRHFGALSHLIDERLGLPDVNRLGKI
jgi:deoxyguanosine kinase